MKNVMKRFIGAVMALITLMACGSFAFADKVSSPEEAKNGVVYITITTSEGSFRGSGFAIGDPNKPVEYIATNFHVAYGIGSRPEVYFSVAANDFFIGTVVAADETKDMAIIKLPQPTEKRTALVLCPSSKVNMEEDFFALGFPALSTSMNFDVSDVSKTKGVISKKTYDDNLCELYETDVSVTGGNSGGPLVNSKGEVVGINSSITYNAQGKINNAIVIDQLMKLADDAGISYVSAADAPKEEPGSDSKDDDSDKDDKDDDKDDDKEGGFNPVPIIIIAVVVVAAAAVVAVVMVMKGKKTPAQVSAPAQSPAPVQGSAPAQGSTPMIICEKGLLANRTFPIGNGVIIGRNTQKCSVCFPVDAKGVSGVHCEIRRNGNVFEIIDLGSSYGTTLGNGQKLTPNVPVTIPSGTYFMIGSAEQLFQIKY